MTDLKNNPAEHSSQLIRHPLVDQIVSECLEWPGYPLKRHNDAKHPVQKICFLADIGLKRNKKPIEEIGHKLLARQADEGAFHTEVLIPSVFGGSNEPEWQWMLCDFPLILYALQAFGFGDDPRVRRGEDFLASLIRENGWPCCSSIPKMKGPGKREHPCPFGNLISLKALSLSETHRNSEVCRIGTDMILDMWEHRASKKYFLFGMGTDFKKLKYPLVWFDILHVTDVLSRFDWVHDDKRFQEMFQVILSKADDKGEYCPESVWMAYKGFDFCQKKDPSPTLTLVVERIKCRLS